MLSQRHSGVPDGCYGNRVRASFVARLCEVLFGFNSVQAVMPGTTLLVRIDTPSRENA